MLGKQVLPVADLPFDFDGVPEDGAQFLFTVRYVGILWPGQYVPFVLTGFIDAMQVCFLISQGLTIHTRCQKRQQTLRPVHPKAALQEHPRCRPRSGGVLSRNGSGTLKRCALSYLSLSRRFADSQYTLEYGPTHDQRSSSPSIKYYSRNEEPCWVVDVHRWGT